MKFFIDTANLDEIREAEAMGIISGVTTNPSLIAKEGRDYEETLREIAQIVDGPISGEVKASTTLARDMVMEGRVISQIHPNMVVKIPMTQEGLKAVKILASEGIKTNVTLVFSATQAILAARAGATYVSPFLGRLDDISTDGTRLIKEVMEIFRLYPDITTRVICASIRHPMHVVECAKTGADIATVPYKVLMQMVQHPLTRTGIEKFCQDFEAVFGR
jgi:transaldolase